MLQVVVSETPKAGNRAGTIVRLLALVPPLIVALFSLLVGLGIPGVTTWFWADPDTNIVEAVWLSDGARVRALALRGESLNLALPVRPALLEDDAPSTMTPLEAAVRRASSDMIALALELGARATPDEAERLQCLALAVGSSEAVELVGLAFGVSAGPCDK